MKQQKAASIAEIECRRVCNAVGSTRIPFPNGMRVPNPCRMPAIKGYQKCKIHGGRGSYPDDHPNVEAADAKWRTACKEYDRISKKYSQETDPIWQAVWGHLPG